MTPVDREHVKDLLAQAARLEPAQRRSFIESAASGRAEIVAEAIELLRTLDDPVFMSAPTGAGFADAPASSMLKAEGPGAKIGHYKLLQSIGEGGFGSVFMAEQSEPVHRKVALKIIKAGMDTKQVIARFEAERQALAMMDHPNIARVLDGGATETGRPYFVMELVRGDPVTQFCDTKRLSVRQRLELFRDVCHAVQHAHQKGIIHRDIKPSNVLVTIADGAPLPKVIDFGIAKATTGKLTDKTLFTEMHQLIGTPEYMSPEQAEVSGVDIDTRSDVYSLGVLLYELLAGSTPLDRTRLRSTPLAEIQRLIREEEPQRPSLRLASGTKFKTPLQVNADTPNSSAIEIAQRRRSEPVQLTRTIRGDLDWIVMKCLEKDRSRRYETASAVANDIGHYLMDEPVEATPPSHSYKLRKFVRRNKATVLAGTIVVGSLLMATAVSIAFAVRTSRALASEERQRNLAQNRAKETEEVAKFQEAQLSSMNPQTMGARLRQALLEKARKAGERDKLPPHDVDARVDDLERLIATCDFTGIALESLDQNFFKPALLAIEEQFADLPLVKARLLQTLASTLCKMGLYDAANDPQLEALAIRQRVLGDEHRDTLASLNKLGLLRQDQGKLAEAEICFREAMEKRRRALGEEDRDTISSINNLGLVLHIQGKRTQAEPYCREALEKYRRVLGNSDPNTLNAIQNMGFVLQAKGKTKEAEVYYHEALERSREVLGEDHPDTIISINNMGFFLQTVGKHAEAEPYYREALEKSRRVLGDEHPDTFVTLVNIAAALKEQGKLDEAMPYARDAMRNCRRVLGNTHPRSVTAIRNLGVLLKWKGSHAEAEAFHREALREYRRTLGDQHPETLDLVGSLGSVLLAQHKYSDAVDLMVPAEPAFRQAFAVSDRLHLGRFFSVLGCARVRLGDFEAAEANLIEAQGILQQASNVPRTDKTGLLTCMVELYDTWEVADPGKGHDSKTAEWKRQLEMFAPSSQDRPP